MASITLGNANNNNNFDNQVARSAVIFVGKNVRWKRGISGIRMRMWRCRRMLETKR